MSIYSIKDLEHLSGIKAHTIRIWEQRHKLFSPQRTDTNIRFYDERDLKLILNISLLKNHGIKISRIVGMTPEEIHQEVLRLSGSEHTDEDQINALTIAMLDMDEKLFLSVLDENQKKFGFEKTMVDIVFPFFRKTGILWMSNSINPAQEHFISHLIRQRLISETERLEHTEKVKSVMLFLPEGELHEISLLFANYMLRARGLRTYYLGQSVPLKDLEAVYHIVNPEYLFTVLTSKPVPGKVQPFIDELGKKFRKAQIFITGSLIVGQEISLQQNIRVITDFNDIDQLPDFKPSLLISR